MAEAGFWGPGHRHALIQLCVGEPFIVQQAVSGLRYLRRTGRQGHETPHCQLLIWLPIPPQGGGRGVEEASSVVWRLLLIQTCVPRFLFHARGGVLLSCVSMSHSSLSRQCRALYTREVLVYFFVHCKTLTATFLGMTHDKLHPN